MKKRVKKKLIAQPGIKNVEQDAAHDTGRDRYW